jgi:hypothetical protein
MKCPCKECLKFPVCSIRCDDLSKHVDNLKLFFEVVGVVTAFIITIAFAFIVIKFSIGEESIKLLISTITALFFTGSLISFFESFEIANYLLRKYPE